MIVILGYDIWYCLYWLDGLFFDFCCTFWVLAGCSGYGLSGRDVSEIFAGVATEDSD